MRTPLLSTFLVLFFTAPAVLAQDKNWKDKPWYLDFGTGAVLQSDQGGVGYEPGFMFSLAVGRHLGGTERLALSVEAEGLFTVNRFDENDLLPGVDTDVKALGLMLNGMADYYFNDTLALYGGLGLGFVPRIEIDLLDQTGVAYDDSTFAWQFMFGVRWRLGGRYDAILGYRYFAPTTLSTGTGDYDPQQHILEVGVRFGLF